VPELCQNSRVLTQCLHWAHASRWHDD
jgi:hypothetical protein